VNVGSRPAAGSSMGGDGGIMLEGVTGGEVVAGIKNVRPMMSSQRVVQLSNELTISRSAAQGPANSLLCHAVMIVFFANLFKLATGRLLCWWLVTRVSKPFPG